MKTIFAVIASLASVTSAQVTALITPTGPAPSGCATSHSDAFSISVLNASSIAKRADLAITLNGGILKDQEDRTGYIASNYQFQFDGPPQAGAIYTGGWSVCSNGSLALGGSAVFYQCLSGSFYNLYTESLGEQCSQIFIQTSAHGSVAGSGAVAATAIAPLFSAAAVSQIPDGQLQAATSAVHVIQISDGQIQGATSAAAGAPVTQTSDGQIQGATSTLAPSAPISQISDGQIQGATSTASLSSEVQATPAATHATGTSSLAGAVISQIVDGQIQAPAATNDMHASATAAPSELIGAASTIQTGNSFIAAAIFLVAALL
ncbi:hypothetical protein DSL72_000443 [Monilinia vaccinii-corymbosi]|uniref:Cell wall mannoprotein PIR1-like C-terminal domain-containing protein n=1 Tax=Monilinia vaccinii-corymbosi TaxID=61207 RepID=A0A8A3NYY9_9HELO|nr:hypothetical protein DSL72_000443 [Monilinia vaccinii-corymbosi]